MTADERRGNTSASNAAYDVLCPGRHLAQRGLLSPPSNYSTTGQRIHEALATGDASALSFAEREIHDACLAIEAKKLAEFFEGDAPKAKAFREDPKAPEKSRLWVRFTTPDGKKLEHSARLDVYHRLMSKALIFEYKSLMGDVPESPRNLQLRDQQCILRGNQLITGDIGVCVIQPMVERNPQICVYTAEDSIRAEAEMFARVAASNNPESKRHPGEDQCKFCSAKVVCREYQQWAGGMVPAMLSVLEVPIADWTPEQRSAAMNALKPAQTLLDNIEKFMREGIAKDPTFCPGWFLKPGNVIETITDAQECFSRFAKLGGTNEQFMRAVRVAKTALREQISAVTGAKGKKLDQAMALLADGISERKQNAPSLKRVAESGGEAIDVS